MSSKTKKTKIWMQKGCIAFGAITLSMLPLHHAVASNSLSEKSSVVVSKNTFGITDIQQQRKSEKRVSGKVKDNTGAGIPGVNISVKGTKTGTVTDLDGNYSIVVPEENSVLVFTYIGFLPSEFKASDSQLREVILKENSKTLDEVVVIGYGDTRKKDLSMAVGSVEFKQSLKSRPLGFAGMLQGQLPGVTISNNGGDPMSAPTLTIRGQGSRSGDQVLYIVDGVPGAPFNTEDVESISVLKDAASAAIYGAHVGSGGVIVVTTKKAKSGKAQVSANVSYGIANATNLPEMTNAAEYCKIMKDAYAAAGRAIPGNVDSSRYPFAEVTRTNWIDEIFRSAMLQHYAVSITGGSDAMKAFASVSYDKDQGVLLNTFKETMGAKFNLDFTINKYVTLSERVGYTFNNGQGGVNTSTHTGVIAQAMFMPASATVYEYDKNGNPVYDLYGNQAFGGTTPTWASAYAGGFGEVRNPVAMLKRLTQYRPSHKLMSTTSLNIKPFSGLTVKSDFTAGFESDRYEDFTKKITEIGKPFDENNRSISSSMANEWLWETTATYSSEIAENHLLTAMAGYTMGYNNYRGNGVTVYGFPNESSWAQNLVNGTDWSKDKPTESFWEESQVSGFGRVSYSFADRYFLTGSLRYDATSKLLKGNRGQAFPAVSAGWKISSEPFFASLRDKISLLKIRGSWGQIGNITSVGHYAGNIKLQESPWFTYFGKDGSNAIKGLSLTTFLNPNLKWETSEQLDFGFDLNLLNDRLSFTADWFRKDTKDLIEQLTVPSVAGIEVAPLGNVGKVRNSGLEFAVNYNDKVGEVHYNIGANFTTLKNEVLNLGDESYIQHTDEVRAFMPLRSAVGESWYSYYVIPTDGLFRSQAEVDDYNQKHGYKNSNGVWIPAQPNAKPGDIRFVDSDGNGIINEGDRVFKGSYAPKYTFALNGGLEWNGFDFSFQLQGVSGNKIFNGTKAMTYPTETGWNLSKDLLNSFTYNPSSNIPRLNVSDQNANLTTTSDFFLEKGDYLRIKNVTVGYTLPKNWMKKLGGNTSVRIYATGENLYTFTGYDGIDPEVGRMGLDGGRYPVSRMFNFGLNVNF
ncbi:SusC/RagA family TonB-linked outer membrane protein [Bacteroides sedimenti]|uniref:SusC/RagA family TonB-linked outer membrane protein n=1 Tax=Bacteroides sedimenti TaxID=2136147 RepID=A0ABM8ICB0_9BACE